MKKFFCIYAFLGLNLALCVDENITKSAITSSNAVFELQKELNILKNKQQEICKEIHKIIINSKKNLGVNDMKKFEDEFKAQMDKNLQNLENKEEFDQDLCIKILPEPKMYQKSSGTFHGPVRQEVMKRKLRVIDSNETIKSNDEQNK
ncbi:MAG: hypothetical protein IJ211_04205 [Campylobacter sp.]|nr:hypothetical protein [Campylobacter sp.]